MSTKTYRLTCEVEVRAYDKRDAWHRIGNYFLSLAENKSCDFLGVAETVPAKLVRAAADAEG